VFNLLLAKLRIGEKTIKQRQAFFTKVEKFDIKESEEVLMLKQITDQVQSEITSAGLRVKKSAR
jgi:hypothetical protein